MFSYRALSACLIVAGIIVSGCHSTAHVAQPNVSAGKPVEMRFTPARTIEVVDANESRRSLPDVVSASGIVAESRGDSVMVSVVSWKRDGEKDDRAEPRPLYAAFAIADPGISYHQRRFSTMKTLVLLGSIVGLIALAIGQASVAGH